MSDEDDYDGGDLFDSEKEEDEDGDIEVSTRTVSKCCLFVGIDFFYFYHEKSERCDYNSNSWLHEMGSYREGL